MKIYSIIFLLILSCIHCHAQEIDGIQIIDYLRTVEHPNCAISKDKFITGPPNDSMWVNMDEETTIYGEFGFPWINGVGEEIILHTAFNLDKYRVKLKLADGSFSQEHFVQTTHWESIDGSIPWVYLFDQGVNCQVTLGLANQRIVKLDFQEDFNLGPSQQVVGIEVVLVPTSAGTDISGIYITENALPCKQVELGNDLIMCSSDTIILSAGDFESYLWSDLSTDSILIINGSELGESIQSFDVTVEDEVGCVTKDTIQITIEKCWTFPDRDICKNVILYPNPTENQLNFEFKNFEIDKQLNIYAADGRLIDQFTLDNNNLSLDISTYSVGVYFVKTNNTYCKFIKILF